MRRLLFPIAAILCSLAGLAACSSDSKSDDAADAGDLVGRSDGGVDLGECGELPEGQAECGAGRALQVCEDATLIGYQCAAGTLCAPDSTTADGVNCVCDNASDGICPDASCTDDVDCAPALPACAGYESEYSAAVGGTIADTGDIFNGWVELDTNPVTDLYLTGPDEGDVSTGPLDLSTTISWTLFVSGTGTNLEPASGTVELEAAAIPDRKLYGELVNALFVDDVDSPTCGTVLNLQFNVLL